MDDHDLVPRGDAAVIFCTIITTTTKYGSTCCKYVYSDRQIRAEWPARRQMAGMGYLTATERYDVRFGPISVTTPEY